MPELRPLRRRQSISWVLLPLRAFLGVTFIYAGLQKLADKHFFSSGSPTSVQSQIHAYARRSPIRSLLLFSGHHSFLVGLAVAFAELAVGLLALLGLWTRAAAVGGMVLALFFLLAVSWHSQPYYYGPDIVFLFAWTPLALAGADRYSLDARFREQARRRMRLAPGGPVTIEFATVRTLCGSYDRGHCQRLGGKACDPSYCPVLAEGAHLKPAVATDLERRTFLRQAAAAGRLSVFALAVGGITALVGRLIPSSPQRPITAVLSTGRPTTTGLPASSVPNSSTPTTSVTPSTAGPTSTSPPTSPPTTANPLGTAIGPSATVPVGGAASFTDPANGDPAFVVQPRAGTFVAFNARCTHQGCPVNFSGASGGQPAAFVCPCHGAAFDATTGAVLQGPARTPLPAIIVTVGPGNQLFVKG